ncbi:Autophagy-related protein 27 [Balamuthia mandrillaris]
MYNSKAGRAVLFGAVVLMGVLSLVSADSCKGKIGEHNYDISKFQGTEVSVQGQHGLYYYMPCGIVEQKKCTEKGAYPSPAVCQKDKNNNYWPVGENDHVEWKARDSNPAGDKGFNLFFAKGDSRETHIEFICDETVDPGTLAVGNPEQTNDGQITTYYLQWTTKYACPGAEPHHGGGSSDKGLLISGGWIFIICLFSVFLIYFVAGVAWQKFKNNATGKDLIPNVNFWISLPGLVKDGIVFTCRGIMGLFNRLTGRSQSYDTI